MATIITDGCLVLATTGELWDPALPKLSGQDNYLHWFRGVRRTFRLNEAGEDITPNQNAFTNPVRNTILLASLETHIRQQVYSVVGFKKLMEHLSELYRPSDEYAQKIAIAEIDRRAKHEHYQPGLSEIKLQSVVEAVLDYVDAGGQLREVDYKFAMQKCVGFQPTKQMEEDLRDFTDANIDRARARRNDLHRYVRGYADLLTKFWPMVRDQSASQKLTRLTVEPAEQLDHLFNQYPISAPSPTTPAHWPASGEWVIAPGSNVHVVNDKKWFKSGTYKDLPEEEQKRSYTYQHSHPVQKVVIAGKGDVEVADSHQRVAYLKNVVYIPGHRFNYISTNTSDLDIKLDSRCCCYVIQANSAGPKRLRDDGSIEAPLHADGYFRVTLYKTLGLTAEKKKDYDLTFPK